MQRSDVSTDASDDRDYFELKDLDHDDWPLEMEGVVHEITALKIEQVDMAEVEPEIPTLFQF